MGILEVLTILFIALKLFGVITWSWWLVLLPEIIAVAFYILIPIVFGAGAVAIFRASKKRKR